MSVACAGETPIPYNYSVICFCFVLIFIYFVGLSAYLAARNADQGCYKKLNTELSGYGTCDPTTNTSCALRLALDENRCSTFIKGISKISRLFSLRSLAKRYLFRSIHLTQKAHPLVQGINYFKTLWYDPSLIRELEIGPNSFTLPNIEKR